MNWRQRQQELASELKEARQRLERAVLAVCSDAAPRHATVDEFLDALDRYIELKTAHV
jgi:hypothetical protein